MGGETLLTRCRGGCPHPPFAGGEYCEDGGCTTHVFANRHARAGGDARPYNSSGTGAKYAAERIRIVTNDMIRGGYRYTYVSRHPGPRGVGDADPYGVVFDLSRLPSPPWLHKTPGGKKGKKVNRLTPQPPSAAAPLCKGSDGGLLPFYPFYLPGPCSATLPITSEKPPGTSPGGLRYSIAQREVSHCPRRHAAWLDKLDIRGYTVIGNLDIRGKG